VVIIVLGSRDCYTLSVIEKIYRFREIFASLIVVDMTVSASQSELAAHISLKGILTDKADIIRRRRAELRTLYTATYIKAFFVEALEGFIFYSGRGFDFVAVTRRRRRGPNKITLYI
jgi:ribonucleotide reductase beta subunit family protein with ferritin-like domain